MPMIVSLVCPQCGQPHRKPRFAAPQRCQCRSCGAAPLRPATEAEIAAPCPPALPLATIALHPAERRRIVEALSAEIGPTAAAAADVVAALPTLWEEPADDYLLVLVHAGERFYPLSLRRPEAGDGAILRDVGFLRQRLAVYGEVRRATEAAFQVLQRQAAPEAG